MSEYDDNIYIDFTDDEASSEGRSYQPLPSGEYDVFVTEIERREVSKGDNEGKPYWNVMLTVNGGEYDNRKLFTSIMLFSIPGKNVLFKLAQLLKATGFAEDVRGIKQVPPAEELEGREAVAIVVRKRDKYKEENEGQPGERLYKNEVNGFKAAGTAGTATQGGPRVASGAGSILP
jgi:hypothetical protein